MPTVSTANIVVPAGKTLAVVNAPAWSKINWTNVIGGLATAGALFIPGFHLDPTTQADIVGTIGLITAGVTILLRTFGHHSPPATSAL